jgi:hypothetical protein
MIKLLSLWLAWRAMRFITAAVVVVGLVAVLVNGHSSALDHGKAALTQLRHTARPLQHQLERTIERAFKP